MLVESFTDRHMPRRMVTTRCVVTCFGVNERPPCLRRSNYMLPWPFVIVGPLLVAAGVLQVVFRVRLANFFADARRRQGGLFAESAAKTQTPALMTVVGVFVAVVGVLLTVRAL